MLAHDPANFISTAGFPSVLQSIAQGAFAIVSALCNSWRVEWAAHAASAVAQDVSVDHYGRDVAVPQELLHGPDVVSALEQMRGK